MGVATIYAKRICVHIWTQSIGLFFPSSDVFLMICIQNVSGQAILYMMELSLLSPPLSVLAPIT